MEGWITLFYSLFGHQALTDEHYTFLKNDSDVKLFRCGKLRKGLLKIYSMESFVYRQLNTASRHRDSSKIDNYGPFALGLGYTFSLEDKDVVVFRGIHIEADKLKKFQDAYERKDWLYLEGWSSCSLDKSVALKYSKTDSKERVSILFTIQITWDSFPILGISNYPSE